MKKSLQSSLLVFLSVFVFIGCASSGVNTKDRIQKVYESDYPEGITVSIYNNEIKKSLFLSDSRFSFGNSKKQVQFTLNNDSSSTYNLLIDTEWLDQRGNKIKTYPRARKIRLSSQSAKRMVLDAPNFKAKDVLINISCSSNCIEKEK